MSRTKKHETETNEMDALELLTADHREVKDFFEKYKKLTGNDADAEQRGELADRICQALSVHAQIEEELFYPAMREEINADDLLDEAEVEHATVKELVEQIMSSEPDEPLFDAKVTVLGEYVAHHVKEEEEQLFPKAKKAKLDLEELGQDLAARKTELMDEEDTVKEDKRPASAARSSSRKSTSHS
ncbi:MAG: hemerythrin domain-containing protein [Methylobacter sp.]|nr:hemerythrin domain-containing protein [Methylobacter sp.]